MSSAHYRRILLKVSGEMLAGEQGSWITGQTIPVNGGYSFAL